MGSVYVGGDSAGLGGYDLVVRSDPKVFTNHGYAIGCTTSFRMIQLLRYQLNPPGFPEDGDVHRHMVTGFIPAVRQCFKDHGFMYRRDDVESGGTFLVGFRGRLFTVYDDMQVAESSYGFAAVGCGECYAMGAMAATKTEEPRKRLRNAMGIAEQFSGGVRGPFRIVKV